MTQNVGAARALQKNLGLPETVSYAENSALGSRQRGTNIEAVMQVRRSLLGVHDEQPDMYRLRTRESRILLAFDISRLAGR